MKIQITQGIGTGPTSLAAFDTALMNAGTANHNLIYLSSIIPPGAKIISRSRNEVEIKGQWGDKLYVVLAQERVEIPNIEAWAGIGWVQEPETGKGLFVEHHGNSEHTVAQDIEDTLNKMMITRGIKDLKIKKSIVGTVCKKQPVCALVVAVYQSELWANT